MRARWLLLIGLLPPPSIAVAAQDNVIFDAPGFLEKKGQKSLPDVKAAPQAWPRLDPGAAFCRTDADLSRLAANRARTGDGGRADCQIMRVATAVQIVRRDGPGRTQVRLTDQPNVTGWTDVWLPEKAPSSR